MRAELVVDLDFEEDGDVYSLLLDWVRDFVRVFGDPFYGASSRSSSASSSRTQTSRVSTPSKSSSLATRRFSNSSGRRWSVESSIRTQTPSRSWTSWLLRRSCVLSPSACRPSRSATQRAARDDPGEESLRRLRDLEPGATLV